ncbi:hypothetical protein Bbelb_224020 [Branchiostoma belcheri]|nr:hypothetical protein Bbelb_224020 [Branchiostoma belcheri]
MLPTATGVSQLQVASCRREQVTPHRCDQIKAKSSHPKGLLLLTGGDCCQVTVAKRRLLRPVRGQVRFSSVRHTDGRHFAGDLLKSITVAMATEVLGDRRRSAWRLGQRKGINSSTARRPAYTRGTTKPSVFTELL